MIDPSSSPSVDVSQHETVPHASAIQVRWTRPTFGTFGYLVVLWGFCAGVSLGIAGFVASLFGVDADIMIGIWRFHGITAGVVGILFVPMLFTLMAAFPLIVYPLFRLGVMAFRGPKLYFRAEGGYGLHFSRLQLRSYVKLSALFGFLSALCALIFPLIDCAIYQGNIDSVSAVAVPNPFHGAVRLVWLVLVVPFIYGAYSAVLGFLTFLPFFLVTRMLAGAAIPSEEVLGEDKAAVPTKFKKRRAVLYATLLALCAIMLLLCAALLSLHAVSTTVEVKEITNEIENRPDEQPGAGNADAAAPTDETSAKDRP
jgi:hypothetical protein